MKPIKEKEKSQSSKFKIMMYTNQVKYAPCDTAEKMRDYIMSKVDPAPLKVAVILHDKDVSDKGEPSEPHFHAVMTFESARSIKRTAKLLNIEPQYIEAFTGKNATENAMGYLIHRTKDAKTKHQYEPSEVKANFEYQDYVDSISKEVTTKNEYASRNKISTLLDLLLAGEITKKELKAQLSGSELAKHKRAIEDVHAEYLIRKADKWREEMIAKNEAITVMWIYGKAAVGKTSLAKELARMYAEHYGEDYFMSGSAKDKLQSYGGEPIILKDELRASNISYSDLLRLFDPFGVDKETMAPSRYTDKAIACNVWIITSPYNPLEFYKTYHLDSTVDTFMQLQRRLTVVIKMTPDEIIEMAFDEGTKIYKPISRKHNSHSSKNRPVELKTNKALELYHQATGSIIEEPIEQESENDGFKELTGSEQQELPFDLV